MELMNKPKVTWRSISSNRKPDRCKKQKIVWTSLTKNGTRMLWQLSNLKSFRKLQTTKRWTCSSNTERTSSRALLKTTWSERFSEVSTKRTDSMLSPTHMVTMLKRPNKVPPKSGEKSSPKNLSKRARSSWAQERTVRRIVRHNRSCKKRQALSLKQRKMNTCSTYKLAQSLSEIKFGKMTLTLRTRSKKSCSTNLFRRHPFMLDSTRLSSPDPPLMMPRIPTQ